MAASKFPTAAHAEADRLLEKIRDAQRAYEHLQWQAAESLRASQEYWGPLLKREKGRVDFLGKELETLMKKATGEIFPERREPGSDRVDLPHGCLIHALALKIRKAKTVTPEKLEELGFPEAVKIVKSVDWDALEDWPDARLFLVGTERKPADDYAWEVKDVSTGPEKCN